MKNNPYKGKYYYWSPERLDVLRQALLVSKDWNEACKIVREKGLRATLGALYTQAFLNKMERPLMKLGGYRIGIRNKTKGQGENNWYAQKEAAKIAYLNEEK